MYARSSGLAFMGLHSRNGKRCIRVPGKNVVGGGKTVENQYKRKQFSISICLFMMCFSFHQVTITLFREDEYGRIGENGFSAQRSYTGPVISTFRLYEYYDPISQCLSTSKISSEYEFLILGDFNSSF